MDILDFIIVTTSLFESFCDEIGGVYYREGTIYLLWVCRIILNFFLKIENISTIPRKGRKNSPKDLGAKYRSCPRTPERPFRFGSI
jgi:hypothetical protein